MFNNEEYKSILPIPLAVIIASGVIIPVTTAVNDENSLKGLLGGYMGLGLGLGVLLLIIRNTFKNNWTDIIPFIMILGIIGLMVSYLYQYFDIIAKGEVSEYYMSFSIISMLFLGAQVIMLISSIFSRSMEISGKLFPTKTFSLLTLLGVINYLIVITIGIILKFYSTQG